MRKLIIFLLAITLTACGAAPATPTEAPTQEVIQPTQTAAVVIQTVVVTVVPTDMPTQVPTATPLPTQTEVPPTATQPPAATDTAVVAAATQPPAASSGLVAVDNALGAGYFTDISVTRNNFSLRCQANKDITFSVKPTDSHVTSVDLYYRIEDRSTGAILDWKNAGRMVPDGKGNFVRTFSGEDINPDLRKANAWFDYQFIGSSSSGVVGRSEKIVQQVSFTLDCP